MAMGSGQAIANASVELRRIDCNNFSNPPEVVTATTDSSGKFTFQNLHAGGWCIVATVAGGGAYLVIALVLRIPELPSIVGLVTAQTRRRRRS